MEIESPLAPVKLYTRAKLFERWGAEQSAVVSESCRAAAFGGTDVGWHGCNVNSTGTRPGLSAAFSASTITVSRYTPMGSPAGLNAIRRVAGAVPLFGPTNASHASPRTKCATQESVPGWAGRGPGESEAGGGGGGLGVSKRPQRGGAGGRGED